VSNLWQSIKDEIRIQLNEFRPFVAYAGTEANGRITIRRVTEVSAGSEEFARVAGVQFQPDDELVCIQVGGKPLPIGRLQRSGVSDLGISYHIAPQNRTAIWYDGSSVVGGTDTTLVLTANFLVAVPFYVGPAGFSADGISIDVTTGVAGNARLGVYAMHATEFRPDALLEDIGTVTTTATGFKQIAITETFEASPPYYIIWLAIVSDAGATVRALGNLLPIFGTISNGSGYGGVSMAHTYGTLPANFSSTPFYNLTLPRLKLKRAA
jgi:hypothetical protein